ncbi:cell wall-binding repeat-containing protein [Clostridium sp. CCUG 7971]|uniref:cell wall-binding repeat-containing protein n=1 Tax=Clostridium sp. CCUG 7971 TaxID=2811414 RepID=UPI001ABB1822|nr:cell wall-binding repeat-containing protein [Clostridium sp. CCUG 7971]MBO3445216.1 cell wall-binding repeat-containing protein [Clostridium sp. CCUG 7971]
MKKIAISIMLVMALSTSMIYANTNNQSRYIIINNESTDPRNYQSTGPVNEINYSKDEYGGLDGMHPIDKVIPFDNTNAPLVTPDKILESKSSNNMSIVGDTKEFNVTNFKNNNEYKISANLEYSGYKVNVWVYKDSITKEEATSIGKEFEKNIYNLVRNNFGNESDVDGDSKINILCYDIIDNFEATGAYTQGYFSPKDLYNVKNSNKCEMFYIDTYPSMGMGSKKDVSEVYSVLAHEFQHMVNYNENVLKENGQDMDVWMNEGLSLAAEQIYLKEPILNRIDYYNTSKAIVNGHSLLYWDYNGDTLANYSLSYLFMEYLRIQANHGNSIYKEIIENPQNNYKAIESVIQKYIDPNIQFGKFMTNFRVALAINESTGKYGFKGEDGFNQIIPRIYAGRETDLRGGGSIVLDASKGRNLEVDNFIGSDLAYVDTGNMSDIQLKRIIGNNRYDTAAKISQETFKDRSNSVVLVNGSSYSDGLSSGPLASLTNSSMLLTSEDRLPNETKNELLRLKPSKVYIIGGENAIKDSVINEISNITKISKSNIVRVAGNNREDTSIQVARYMQNISDVNTLYLVNGYKGEADAMSILSKASKDRQPIIITNGNKLKDENLKWIKNIGTKNIYVIGGDLVMSPSFINNVGKVVGTNLEQNRIYGANRQETNAKVFNKFYKNVDTVIITKSDELIDALSVGVLAGIKNAPIVIGTNRITESQIKAIKESGYKNVIEVGGNINPKVISSIR